MTLKLDPTHIDLATLRRLWQGEPCKLDGASLDRIRASAVAVEQVLQDPTPYLGKTMKLKGPILGTCAKKGCWMRVGGRVLALEDPTAGVDVGAKAEIYRLLADAVGRGLAVILISTDLEEVAAICHRALVFRDGRIVGALQGAELTFEKLIHAASLTPDAAAEDIAPCSP